MTCTATASHVTAYLADTTDKATPRLLQANNSCSNLTEVPAIAEDYKDLGELGVRTGRWSVEEHNAFVAALHTYGKDWQRLQEAVPT